MGKDVRRTLSPWKALLMVGDWLAARPTLMITEQQSMAATHTHTHTHARTPTTVTAYYKDLVAATHWAIYCKGPVLKEVVRQMMIFQKSTRYGQALCGWHAWEPTLPQADCDGQYQRGGK